MLPAHPGQRQPRYFFDPVGYVTVAEIARFAGVCTPPRLFPFRWE